MKLDIQLSTRAGSVRSWRIMIEDSIIGWVSYDEDAATARRWTWSTKADDLPLPAIDRDHALIRLLEDHAEQLRLRAAQIKVMARAATAEWPAFPNT